MSVQLIRGDRRDLGGFTVSRILPHAGRRNVGPFVFFDHMGPADFAPGHGVAVRPHPHIGLATVTYLFEGAMMHRDSIGSCQKIVPGDVNWMSAGHGVVHSERSPEDLMARGHRVHGIQIWVAQALGEEQQAPTFRHVSNKDLPRIEKDGLDLTLVLGQAFDLIAPIHHSLPLFYAHVVMQPGAHLEVPDEFPERAVYAVDQTVLVDGILLGAHQMAFAASQQPLTVDAPEGATVMIIGGVALDAPRRLEWNFVASSQAQIDEARNNWRDYPNAQFPAVPGETEWIALPETA